MSVYVIYICIYAARVFTRDDVASFSKSSAGERKARDIYTICFIYLYILCIYMYIYGSSTELSANYNDGRDG